MSEREAERWHRLRPLFDRALDLQGPERLEFLADLSGPDAELREDLERLLEEQARNENSPSLTPEGFAAPLLARALRDEAALDDERIGQQIGVFRLVRLIGSGGMGSVYLAERSSGDFVQEVAIKVIRHTVASAVARERFEQERQILAGLAHPNIAKLLDGGQTPDGQPYYTMEYVAGVPITDYCRDHKLSVENRIRLLLKVATALAYAHQHLVVHRDIKPSNILVKADGQVMLLDFGIAKLVGEAAQQTVTQAAVGPMTPEYAAPEQFRNAKITIATDIYQLGALCYRVLTGRLPYHADPTDSYAWARAVAEDDPITLRRTLTDSRAVGIEPGARSLAWLRRRVAGDLDAILRKAMAKAPADRYQSMDSLAADLNRFLEGRPVSARQMGALYYAWRFVMRHRVAVSTTAALMGLLLATAITALHNAHQAERQADRAEREAAVRLVTRSMLTDLLRVGPASIAHPTSSLEALDQGAERILRALQSSPQERSIAVGVLATSYLDLDHAQRAQALIERTLRETGNVKRDATPESLQLELLLARAAVESGNLQSAQTSLRIAEITMKTLGEQEISQNRLAVATTRLRIAEVSGSSREASDQATLLLQEYDTDQFKETSEFAELLHACAISYANAGDDRISSRMQERRWKVLAKIYGDDSTTAFKAQRDWISEDTQMSDRAEADKFLADQEVKIREMFGTHSPDYADVLEFQCARDMQNEQYERAALTCKQSLTVQLEVRDFNSPDVGFAYRNLGATFNSLGRHADALVQMELALPILERTLASNTNPVITTRIDIAMTRCRSGAVDRSIEEFEHAVDDFVAQFGAAHPYEPVYAARFANCLLDAGRVSQARVVLETHGTIGLPREGMTQTWLAEIAATWHRLPPTQ